MNDGTKGLIGSDKTAFVMMRLTDHGVFLDTNWNQGKPFFAPMGDTDIQEKLAECWGINFNGQVFYAPDVE